MSATDLPAVNAGLNTISAVFLILGYSRISRGLIQAHKRMMLAALATSATFLAFYLVNHYAVGSVPYPHHDWTRPVYFAVLISHTVLAAAILPLVLVTTVRALRGRFAAHRAIARVTLPLWGWVSLSGVVVYWMLYRL